MRIQFLAFIFLITGTAFSQQELTLGNFHPNVSVSVMRIPDKNFSDGSGSYGSQQAHVGLTVPLSTDHDISEEGVSVSRLSLHINGTAARPEISFLSHSHTLYSVNAGLNGVYIGTSHNLYLLSVSSGFAEDENTISSPDLRFTVYGIGTYATSASFRWLYGAAYTYVLGKEALLPIGGIHWKPADRWSFAALVPFYLSLRYRPSDGVSLGLNIVLGGDRLGFTSHGEILGAPNRTSLRITQMRVGMNASVRITDDFYLTGELGAVGGRTLWISDRNTDFWNKKIEPSGYISVGARFIFGEVLEMPE